MSSISENPPLRKPWLALGMPTKAAWEAELKRLKATPHGKRIEDGHNVIMAVLACHPNAAEKIGCGVDHFETGPGPDSYGTTCFFVVRTDGTRASFSYRTALAGKVNPWSALLAALREAVSLDILAWKVDQVDGNGLGTCAISGKRIHMSEAHADHVHPKTFHVLARTWAGNEGIDPRFVAYEDSPMWRLRDKGLEDRWIEFHRLHAELRLLSAEIFGRINNKATVRPVA